MKPVILKPTAWAKIRTELHKEYPKSVFMLRNKMKDKLGFSVREHQAWIKTQPNPEEFVGEGYYEHQIHLDFYSEKKRTMFLMKWSEFLNEKL